MQMDRLVVKYFCRSLTSRLVAAEMFRLGRSASYGLETPRSIAEGAIAGEGSTFAPSTSPPLRPSMPEAVGAGTAFHLFRSGTGRHVALLVDGEKILHVESTVPWSVVSCLDFGEAHNSVMAESRCVDPI